MSHNHLRRKRKILFLDRDDTIIKDFGYLNDPAQVKLLDGLIPALKLFRDAGFEFIVTTNQSGLTRGSVQAESLIHIHAKIQKLLNLQGIRILDFYSAPYIHAHKRRKPGPGLTLNAMEDYGVDLPNSIFAGDKWRDLDVGFNFGSKTILVNEAKNQRAYFKNFEPNLSLKSWSDFTVDVFKSLLEGKTHNLTEMAFDCLDPAFLASRSKRKVSSSYRSEQNLNFKNN